MQPEAIRRSLPDERRSITYKFALSTPEGEKKFYLTVSTYDGDEERLGEVFIKAGKEGSFISAALDLLMTSISIGLQYGVPLRAYTQKMRHVQCEPAGLVLTNTPQGLDGHPDSQKFFAKSPFDFIAALLDHHFPDGCRRRS